MRIAKISDLTGVHPQTLRYWESLGLIHSAKTEGGHRRYSPEAVSRVNYIVSIGGVSKMLKNMHFSLLDLQRPKTIGTAGEFEHNSYLDLVIYDGKHIVQEIPARIDLLFIFNDGRQIQQVDAFLLLHHKFKNPPELIQANLPIDMLSPDSLSSCYKDVNLGLTHKKSLCLDSFQDVDEVKLSGEPVREVVPYFLPKRHFLGRRCIRGPSVWNSVCLSSFLICDGTPIHEMRM